MAPATKATVVHALLQRVANDAAVRLPTLARPTSRARGRGRAHARGRAHTLALACSAGRIVRSLCGCDRLSRATQRHNQDSKFTPEQHRAHVRQVQYILAITDDLDPRDRLAAINACKSTLYCHVHSMQGAWSGGVHLEPLVRVGELYLHSRKLAKLFSEGRVNCRFLSLVYFHDLDQQDALAFEEVRGRPGPPWAAPAALPAASRPPAPPAPCVRAHQPN